MSAPGPSEAPFAAPFAAPWEAQVFALVVALQERGLFTAQDWARALGQAIQPEGTADYRRWLVALESLLHERGLTRPGLVEARTDAFLRAAAATPHGQPIRLENDPERGQGP